MTIKEHALDFFENSDAADAAYQELACHRIRADNMSMLEREEAERLNKVRHQCRDCGGTGRATTGEYEYRPYCLWCQGTGETESNASDSTTEQADSKGISADKVLELLRDIEQRVQAIHREPIHAERNAKLVELKGVLNRAIIEYGEQK